MSSDAPSTTLPETHSLNDLLARVEAATGPDREIDASIYNAMVDDGGRRAFRVSNWSRGRAPMLGRYHDGWLTGKSEDDIYADDLVRFTASIDAALALVERVLPGWGADVGYPARMGEHHGQPWADVWASREDERYRWDRSLGRPTPRHSNAPTVPLAILAALLKALQAQTSESPAREGASLQGSAQ
jgi:hypothetical protein